MSQRKPILLTTLLVSAIMLSACGGGSGGDKKPREDGEGAKPPITGGNTGGGTKGPGGGTNPPGGGTTEDNRFLGPNGEFRNLDQEPNNGDNDKFTQLDDLTNLKGQVNTQNDEYDLYSFSLSEPGSYRLTLTGFGGNDLDLYLADEREEDPIFLGQNDPGQDEVVELELDADADYVLIVHGFNTAGQTSDYRLVVEKIGGGSGGGSGSGSSTGDSEPNDQASESNQLPLNREITGTVNATEDSVDYYVVELPAGTNIVMLYGLDGAGVNFDITLGPGGAVAGSGEPMRNPDGFRASITIEQPARLGIRVVATNTNGRDQPYTLKATTE